MKKWFSLFLICALSISFLFPLFAHAHSGDTDSNGGHYNRTTGEYHYHHGYSAHQHYDMDGDGDHDCPFEFNGKRYPSYDQYANSNGRWFSYADFDKAIEEEYQNGYKEGKSVGYAIGQKETEEEYQKIVEDAEEVAENNSYKLSAIVGALIVAAACFSSKKRKQTEESKKNPSDYEYKRIIDTLEIISKETGCSIDTLGDSLYISLRKAQGKTEDEAHSELMMHRYSIKPKVKPHNGAILAEPFMPLNVLKSFTRDKDGDLILEMMDGSEYCYYYFPKSLYREMKNFYNTAEFIDRYVKGKYTCEKIS